MKKVIKIIISCLLTVFILCTLFFFWASSPTLTEENYQKISVNNFEQITDNDSIYSIVTYNIGYLSGMTNNLAIEKPETLFDKNLKKVVSEIKNINPDFIAFQEIDFASVRSFNVNQQDEIAKLGYNYVAEAINWDETYVPFPYWPPSLHFGKTVSGQSILSKYPLKNQDRIVLERVKSSPFYRDAFYMERIIQVVKAVIENKEIVIMNVHLEAFDPPTREHQMEVVMKLFKQYGTTNPTILLGDFNSDPKNPKASIKKFLVDPTIGNSAFTSENYESTFNSENPIARLDYIFYTNNSIDYIGGSVLKQFEQASDHLPVELLFKLK